MSKKKTKAFKTPQTDSVVVHNAFHPKSKELVYADFARELEVKLYQAYAEIDRIKELLEMALEPEMFHTASLKKDYEKIKSN